MACAAASRRHSSTRRRASALRLDVRACNLRHGTRLSRAMPDESQPSRGGRWKILLQFGVSALAVWLIARRVDLRESAHLVAGARAGYVVAAIALYVVGQVLSAYRWRLIGVSVGLVRPPTHPIRRFVETDLGPFWRDRGMLVGASAVSLVFHFVQIATQFIVARALGLDVPFTYICIFHPLVSALAAIPITLSGI